MGISRKKMNGQKVILLTIEINLSADGKRGLGAVMKGGKKKKTPKNISGGGLGWLFQWKMGEETR